MWSLSQYLALYSPFSWGRRKVEQLYEEMKEGDNGTSCQAPPDLVTTRRWGGGSTGFGGWPWITETTENEAMEKWGDYSILLYTYVLK